MFMRDARDLSISTIEAACVVRFSATRLRVQGQILEPLSVCNALFYPCLKTQM